MARLVGKRTGPPYLLVVFVFLFLVAGVVAFLMYQEMDTQRAGRDKAEKTNETLAGDIKTDEDLKALMKEIQDDPNNGPTVVANLRRQIRQLTAAINGAPAPTQVAMAASDAAVKLMDAPQGLAAEVRTVRDLLTQRNNTIKDKDGEITKLNADKAQMKAEKGAADANYVADLAKLGEERTALREQNAGNLARFEKELATAKDDFKKKTGELESIIAEKNNTIQDMTTKLRAAEVQIQTKDRQVQELTGKGKIIVEIKPAGKVMRVVENANICYISIGTDDQVSPGLTFAVYAEGGIGAGDPNNKASIEVTSVGKNTSECRIVTQKKDDPISVGDVIVNVAFSSGRTQAFVVEGVFDLHGEGKATSQGTEEVKNMITRFGGKVVQELDFKTDFVVLGEEPMKPPKPQAGSDATAEKVYSEKLKEWERYQAIRDAANNMKIPILNTNRFLAMVGQGALKLGK
jgi:hypothetical protein